MQVYIKRIPYDKELRLDDADMRRYRVTTRWRWWRATIWPHMGYIALLLLFVFAGHRDPDSAGIIYPVPTVAVVAEPTPSPVPSQSVPQTSLRPPSNPWSNDASLYDAGTCGGVADGSGWSGSLMWPVDSQQIKEGRAFRLGHPALDIEAALDSPVYAAATGEVVWAGWSRWGGGNIVVLAHGNTWQTHYAHMNEVLISCGQVVARGTQIGTVGQSGASNFPHLHFEVRYKGMAYDALTWLP